MTAIRNPFVFLGQVITGGCKDHCIGLTYRGHIVLFDHVDYDGARAEAALLDFAGEDLSSCICGSILVVHQRRTKSTTNLSRELRRFQERPRRALMRNIIANDLIDPRRRYLQSWSISSMAARLVSLVHAKHMRSLPVAHADLLQIRARP